MSINSVNGVLEDETNMLLPRLITILVGLPLLVMCIHWGGIPFVLLIAGIILLGLREFYRMAIQGGYDAQSFLGTLAGVLILGCMLWSGSHAGVHKENIIISICIAGLFIVFFTRELFSKSLRQSLLRVSITFFGIFYVVWTLGHLCLLRELRPLGREYTYFLFFIIWTVDFMAYVAGKKFGRFRLNSKVSPGKTIEGTMGGIISGVLIGVFLQPIIFPDMPIMNIAVMSLCIGIAAQFSDLSESVIKRSFGVKDSSDLLPGHGGILDRFDSFIFTAPLLYYYLLLQG
ncbi:MAG: phosphatidate cytidylyltransferase [bacterium]